MPPETAAVHGSFDFALVSLAQVQMRVASADDSGAAGKVPSALRFSQLR